MRSQTCPRRRFFLHTISPALNYKSALMKSEKEKRIFLLALEQAAAYRPQFLLEACKSDTELRASVRLLLDCHERLGMFLEPSVLEPCGDLPPTTGSARPVG